ncbi:hypothetical protein DU508_09865 [Pedobacter chinensis]|uniref:Uncharacterized protein n=1 Tax=Pedobacter chinensis TaxID=2282421 RepID=A0A369Q3D9_9SPHI|nr:hypothetical protein DU508_09865 [Pedobacter chinensis]
MCSCDSGPETNGAALLNTNKNLKTNEKFSMTIVHVWCFKRLAKPPRHAEFISASFQLGVHAIKVLKQTAQPS